MDMTENDRKNKPNLPRPSLIRRKSSVEDSEMIQALTTAMNAFPHEERVQFSCLKVIRHIVPSTICDEPSLPEKDMTSTIGEPKEGNKPQEDQALNRMTIESMVNIILRAMQACSKSVELQILCVTILTDMCELSIVDGSRVCDAIIDAGGLIRLSETMTFHRRLPVATAARRLHQKLSQYMQVLESISTLSLNSTMTSCDSLDDSLVIGDEYKEEF